MKSTGFALLALAFVWCAARAGDDSARAAPWVQARHVLEATVADLNAGGIRALRPHAGELEEVLAEADKAFVVPEKGDVIVLTDGPADTLMALLVVSKAHPDRKTIAVPDPYPYIAFYLGSYYNDIHRVADALRVFERQRALEPNSMSLLRSSLISERAIALSGLGRRPEALAVYEEGLKLDGLNAKDKARMLRGRGYILTEMERLDEAEAAYNESLTVEPGNPLAKNEIEYIRRLRLGGNKAPGGITMPDSKPVKK